MKAHTVQEVPSQLEIDLQPPPEAGISPWVLLVVMPLAIAAVKVWEKWVPSKTDHTETVAKVYQDQTATLSNQVKTFSEQISSMQNRLDKVERMLAQERLSRNTAEDIALKLISMLEENVHQWHIRLAAREKNDPEKKLTWVPDPPPHILDLTTVQKYREMIQNYDPT